MERTQATKIIIEAKRRLGLKGLDIANVIERSETWTATALLGQATMSLEEAQKVVAMQQMKLKKH